MQEGHDTMWWAFAHKAPDLRLRGRLYGRPYLGRSSVRDVPEQEYPLNWEISLCPHLNNRA